MKIVPVLWSNFSDEPALLRDQVLEAFHRVLNSGQYILGPEVDRFEKAWAQSCGASYAIGVGNATDGIELGLRAIGIGPGDEVITTPITAFATILGILRTGATPVLADINPLTALLDLDCAKKLITSNTKAILLVHLYGLIDQMDQWKQLCQEYHIHLLEDCAHAHGALWEQQKAGTFGSFGVYSFYPTKNLGALGDAGAVVTNYQEIAEKIKIMRHYGEVSANHYMGIGMNSRLDEIQAAILFTKMQWLPQFLLRRQQIAMYYDEQLNHGRFYHPGRSIKSAQHAYHLYVIRTQGRGDIRFRLQEKKIETRIHYQIPQYDSSGSLELQYPSEGVPHAENHADQCLSLPCFPQMTDAQVCYVVETLNDLDL